MVTLPFSTDSVYQDSSGRRVSVDKARFYLSGPALLTDNGNLHVGVSIDVGGGIGFCAEHSAIASMITDGEQSIRRIVAVLGDGTILPPCGRCREFMRQVDRDNLDRTEVLLSKDKIMKLRDLLPHPWDEVF